MAAPSDTKFQVNLKTPNGALINLYATSDFELKEQLDSLRERLAPEIAAVDALLTGASVVASTPPASQQVSQQQAPQAPPQQQYQQQPAQQAQVQQGPREKQDRWGNTWVYDHPDAPQTPRGPAVMKVWTAQSGKLTRRWSDPASGPEWFEQRKPKVPKEQQWDGEFVRGNG